MAPKVIKPEYVAAEPELIRAPLDPDDPVPLRVNASAVAKV